MQPRENEDHQFNLGKNEVNQCPDFTCNISTVLKQEHYNMVYHWKKQPEPGSLYHKQN